MSQDPKQTLPKQKQDEQPGVESKMNPTPKYIRDDYKGSDKLKNKVVVITGGDSGIGRAVSIHFAREGSDIVIIYLNEHDDAMDTKRLVEQEGRKCLLINGDVGNPTFCEAAITEAIDKFNKIDILINNAAEQHPVHDVMDISNDQFEKTFRTNIFGAFYMTKAVLPHLKSGSTIINTSSVVAYEGMEELIDYSATKGALTSFTRSLSLSLIKKGIRVNGVAPGPIWTPLIPSTFDVDKTSTFGGQTPIGRPGETMELAPAYVYLASKDSSYVNGQIIHINGGMIVNG